MEQNRSEYTSSDCKIKRFIICQQMVTKKAPSKGAFYLFIEKEFKADVKPN